jgi:hypothetical protein
VRLWHVTKETVWAELRAHRPYDGLQIGGAFGLSDPERLAMRQLGAVD